MGLCFSCKEELSVDVVLKLPHGEKGIRYRDGSFHHLESIQDWISGIWKSRPWTGWLAYNDETTVITSKTKGHCKGIVCWNDVTIGWWIHSVPHFPTSLTATSISPILPSELVYGQSFVYVEMEFTESKLQGIMDQIKWMDANLFLQHNVPSMIPRSKEPSIKQMELSDTIVHHAKSSQHTIDIYAEHLCHLDTSDWYIETWRRGSPLPETNSSIHDVNRLTWASTDYKESQDHSKWAVSKHYVWIGDLNRMESQTRRGGGGVMIQDKEMVKAFRNLIIS